MNTAKKNLDTMKKYNWQLGYSSMTLLDKIKISKFILTNDKWTLGPEIEKYENKWSKYTGSPYVVMVGSGSEANELIALHRKEELKKQGSWNCGKNKVLFNVVNWISSVSVWINFSFKPVFVDVDLRNLNPSVKQILEKLDKDKDIDTVFYTTLLGQSCHLETLAKECQKRGVKLLLDNCESSFSWETFNKTHPFDSYNRHFCNITTSSTSVYASHFTSGMQEGGLIFCQTLEEANWYRMARNHGMTRGMPEEYKNPDVDPSFDFNLVGSNYRSTNLIAYMHSLDFDRSLKWSEENRRSISEVFYSNLNSYDGKLSKKVYKYLNQHVNSESGHMLLSLPIIRDPKYPDKELIQKVKGYLNAAGVGYRGLVGSNLLRHTAFKEYGNPKDYPNADYLHYNSIYIGLHAGITVEMVKELASELSKL